MCKKIIIFIFLYVPILLMAQKKGDYIWLGGIDVYESLGYVEGYYLDYNQINSSPIFHTYKYGFDRNNASICDAEGQLLLYTNGCAVMNRYHEVMPNGEGINKGEWYDKYWKDCKYGHPGYQDVLILPDPGYKDGYYVFHKFRVDNPGGEALLKLMYTYVDMSSDGGKGTVVNKNVPYLTDTFINYSYFTSIQHANQRDWWNVLPAREDSVFINFLLDEEGIHGPFYQDAATYFFARVNAAGTARFSPDGSKYNQLDIVYHIL